MISGVLRILDALSNGGVMTEQLTVGIDAPRGALAGGILASRWFLVLRYCADVVTQANRRFLLVRDVSN
jgi:hypothetical protein